MNGSSRLALKFNRRLGLVGFAALGSLLCTGATSPTGCQPEPQPVHIGPSPGEVIGASVGIGAALAVVTVVAIEHSHHTLKGCVFSGPDGLALHTSDSRVFTLEGAADNVKPGDRVKFHGSKVKKTKADDTSGQVFVVEKITKDYGPCPVQVASNPGPMR